MIEIRNNDPIIRPAKTTDSRKVERKLDKIHEDEEQRRESRRKKRRANQLKKKKSGSQDSNGGNELDVRV